MNERDDILATDEPADTSAAALEDSLAGTDGILDPEEPETAGADIGIEPASESVDYEAMMEDELRALKRDFPEMRDAVSITELESPIRYAELRDLGLSPREAYLATSGRRKRTDNRRHLFSAVPRGSGAPVSGMTHAELESARELFPGLGDRELMGLYKKVRA